VKLANRPGELLFEQKAFLAKTPSTAKAAKKNAKKSARKSARKHKEASV
jgi:hypothetical protein